VTGDELAARKQAIENLGKGNPIVDEDVVSITQQLATLGMPLDSEN
jgi:hypothetical protein